MAAAALLVALLHQEQAGAPSTQRVVALPDEMAAFRQSRPAGQMALTTYVSQTIIGVALFYGVGLGLHGTIGLLEGTMLAIGIFAAQCVIARFWLRWFRFGPIEWIWRRMTYGAPIAFLRNASPNASSASV